MEGTMVKALKSKTAEDRAKHFLAELLDETLDWSCTDTQHELAYALKEILEDYCPDWIDPYRVSEE